MKAMILAAGLGTRLRPLSHKIPKPMIPVLGIPMIQHTLNLLKSAGITEVMINLHHLPGDLKAYLKKQKDFKISFSMEKKLLGTGGGILKAKPFFGNERFFVLNSDFLSDINLEDVLSFHLEKKALVTLVMKIPASSSRYDWVSLNKEHRILQFRATEIKPPLIKGIFTGIHILEPDIFAFFPKGKKIFCIVRDVYMNLVERDFPIFGYPFKGAWHDLGSLDLYLKFHLKKLRAKEKDQFKNTLLKLCPGLIFPRITG